MKVFIHTDLEGVSSFYDWSEANIPTSRGIGYTKEFLTQEVNACIEGICAVDPNAQVVIEDGHGGGFYGQNMIAEKLHPQSKLITGRFYRHLSTIDSSFDMLMMIGAHSMAGTQHGQMNHTLSKDSIYNVSLNGINIGEIGICAAIAGYYNVPLAMVSGDYWAAVEAESLIDGVVTASVKKGLNSFCAECLHPDRACELIRESAQRAAESKSKIKPYRPGDHIEVRIDYLHTELADEAERQKGAKRVSGRCVVFEGDDLRQVFNRCF